MTKMCDASTVSAISILPSKILRQFTRDYKAMKSGGTHQIAFDFKECELCYQKPRQEDAMLKLILAILTQSDPHS
jgi:hypothetical protein